MRENSRTKSAESETVAMERMQTERTKSHCAGMDGKLAELLLDAGTAPAKVHLHVAGCDRCCSELEELQATMALLDSWDAAEPNPYFLTRLEARMREERQAAPARWRWIARLRDRMAYGQVTHVRPLAAMALTMMLLVGGGTYLGITDWDHVTAPAGQATVVKDLQVLDNDAQLLDQLETLSSASDNGD